MVDSVNLFESSATVFTSPSCGICSLGDAISCTVTEELNGEFELTMEYPVSGKGYSELSLRRIICAKPNPNDVRQPFRIYSITRPIDGIATVHAEHLSYDLSGYPDGPFSVSSASAAMANLSSKSAIPCPFTFSTSLTASGEFDVIRPASIRSLLGGSDNSILNTYGGEFIFDNYSVTLVSQRGADRAVYIRYGKNLTDLEQEENCGDIYTGVYPFWYSESSGLVQLDEKYVYGSGTYDFTKIVPLDLSSEWEQAPTQFELKDRAKTFMKLNGVGVPKVSLTVSFLQLSESSEYSELIPLENVYLGDTVHVIFEKLNVTATARCISVVYDALSGRYVEISLGDAKASLSDTITDQARSIDTAVDKTFVQQAAENATKLITGGLGGYVLLHSSSGGSQPDEILIMNTNDINTATKIWRWNLGGLGYSSTGYGGPYSTAITMDGSIVASFITAGVMSAARVDLTNYSTSSQVTSQISNEIGGMRLEVTNGYDSSNISLKSGSIYLSSGNISITGAVTFSDLMSSGHTVINGSNITTGTLNADLVTTGKLKTDVIATNEQGYVVFTAPLSVPYAEGLSALYFGPYAYLRKDDYTSDTPLYVYSYTPFRFMYTTPNVYIGGVDYPVLNANNYSAYMTARFG
jgi:phage minor structural protein